MSKNFLNLFQKSFLIYYYYYIPMGIKKISNCSRDTFGKHYNYVCRVIFLLQLGDKNMYFILLSY